MRFAQPRSFVRCPGAEHPSPIFGALREYVDEQGGELELAQLDVARVRALLAGGAVSDRADGKLEAAPDESERRERMAAQLDRFFQERASVGKG